jgi:hypothetical protein
MKKRYRRRAAKPGQLIAYWGKTSRHDAPDVCIAWGGDGAVRADGHLLYGALCAKRIEPCLRSESPIGSDHRFIHSFVEELERRGYDLTTLRFSVEQTKTA